jgi:alpha-ketoglutarate-dependent taurine dioxygenase
VQAVPLTDASGAELVDFDIAATSSMDDRVELRRLFRKHHLLLVRGQAPSAADHDRFVGWFGPLQQNRVSADAGYVTNPEHPRSLFGPDLKVLLWHLDGAYGPRPGIATSLWAEVVSLDAPPTLFANAARGSIGSPGIRRSSDAQVVAIDAESGTIYRRTHV